MKPIAGINRVRGVSHFGGDKEALLLAGLPIVNQMAVAAGAFVAEIAGVHAVAFGDQGHAVGFTDLAAAHGFVAAVPDAENNPALGGAVHLHSEIAAMPATRLEVSPQRRFHAGHFAVKSINVGDA